MTLTENTKGNKRFRETDQNETRNKTNRTQRHAEHKDIHNAKTYITQRHTEHKDIW